MLLTNNSAVRAKFLGGALGGYSPMSGVTSSKYMANALAFGRDVSVPEGYQSIKRAMVPPLLTSGKIASRSRIDVDSTGQLFADGLLTGAASFDIDATVSGNVASNGQVAFALDVDATASIRALGNCSVVVDIIGRPSAFDIAQEIWQAQASAYNAPGTMGARVNAAGAAGNPWEANLADNNTPGTFGAFVQKLLSVAKFLALK